MTNISHNLAQILKQISAAEQKYSRNIGDVSLLAVSKFHPASVIQEAYSAGQRHFGENYAQELEEKALALKPLNIIWHFIGPIQSNKTQIIATHCSWAHSIDRLKIAQRLNKQRPQHLPPLQVCIQVNIDNEDSKSGVLESELDMLVQQTRALANLNLRGLMAIPSQQEPQSAFKRLAALAERYSLDTLSMGMSADMEAAIGAGSTMVRIGTALFGQRPNTTKRDSSQ